MAMMLNEVVLKFTLETTSPGVADRLMSVLQNARDNAIHFQNSSFTAVRGDQQIIYQGSPLKGALWSLQLIRRLFS